MPKHFGNLTVIHGCMFSGKTGELIRLIKRAKIAGKHVLVFKPTIDNRYTNNSVASHDGFLEDAICIDKSTDILNIVFSSGGTHVIAIDEVQFLDFEIESVIEFLLDLNYDVIIAGLDTDFRAEPFGSMPNLIAKADETIHLKAICLVCGEDAIRTQRVINGKPADYNDPIILVGAKESYEARCREHHDVPNKPEINY
jgi:thymidine kinase